MSPRRPDRNTDTESNPITNFLLIKYHPSFRDIIHKHRGTSGKQAWEKGSGTGGIKLATLQGKLELHDTRPRRNQLV